MKWMLYILLVSSYIFLRKKEQFKLQIPHEHIWTDCCGSKSLWFWISFTCHQTLLSHIQFHFLGGRCNTSCHREWWAAVFVHSSSRGFQETLSRILFQVFKLSYITKETDVMGIFKLPLLFRVMSQYSINIDLSIPVESLVLDHDNYISLLYCNFQAFRNDTDFRSDLINLKARKVAIVVMILARRRMSYFP